MVQRSTSRRCGRGNKQFREGNGAGGVRIYMNTNAMNISFQLLKAEDFAGEANGYGEGRSGASRQEALRCI